MIDLRSDTVTVPDDAMYDAMRRAPLGDDVLGDDPTVRRLEELAASRLGKEAGLFVPTGTMGNSIAVAVHTRPGDEAIFEELCHTYNYECGGLARLWGVQARTIRGDRGRMSLADLASAVRSTTDIHVPRTSLIIVEQTANISGGCVLPLEHLRDVAAFARERDLRVHIDGARIFNASVASGVPVADFAATADTVMFCISKGLGAPAGSLLVGSRATIERARGIRKLLGGGLRQAGVLAACGIHALEHNVERLAEDHARARELAERLLPLAARGADVPAPDTNIVFLRWAGADPAAYVRFSDRLAASGVATIPLGDLGVRAVFHRDISAEAASRATEAIARELEATLSHA